MTALHLMRLTIEARSPISIGSGAEVTVDIPTLDGEKKTQVMEIMRDANGLPTVPGSSTQGVVRHLLNAEGEDADRILGREDRDGSGRAGKVSFSWGCVHGADDVAVTGLKNLNGTNDVFLKCLLQKTPLFRDRVALNAQHSVDGHKKFSRNAVPVGTRFSFQLEAWGGEEARENLLLIARMFAHPDFRLGGASGAGYGRVRLVRASHACPALDNPDSLRKLRGPLPIGPREENLFENVVLTPPESRATRLTLELDFADAVRVGAMTPPTGTAENELFRTLWVMREICFDPETGAEKTRFPLPGSGFRGPIAHRAAFYANKAENRMIDVDKMLAFNPIEQEEKLLAMSQRPEALLEFLGHAKEKPGDPHDGSASRLVVDDTCFTSGTDDGEQDLATRRFQHVSIDRFTGGARDQTGGLFNEEMLTRPHVQVVLHLHPPREPAREPGPDNADAPGGWDAVVSESFLRAVRDICTGRLPIGARSLGICTGTASFDGPGAEGWKKIAQGVGLPLQDGEARP